MLTHKTLQCQRLDGTPVEVRVNALPLSKMEEFLNAVGEPYDVVKLTTSITNPDELFAGSVMDIDEAAQELNNPLVDRLLKRTQATTAYMRQFIPVEKPTPSRTSSPTSSPTAAQTTGTAPKP